MFLSVHLKMYLDLAISDTGATYAKCQCGKQMEEHPTESDHRVFTCICGSHVVPLISGHHEPVGKVRDLFSHYDKNDADLIVNRYDTYIIYALVPKKFQYYRCKVQYSDVYFLGALTANDVARYFLSDSDIIHKYAFDNNTNRYDKRDYPHKLWVTYNFLLENNLMHGLEAVYYHLIHPFSESEVAIKLLDRYGSPI